jgi:hypothetical protein
MNKITAHFSSYLYNCLLLLKISDFLKSLFWKESVQIIPLSPSSLLKKEWSLTYEKLAKTWPFWIPFWEAANILFAGTY